MMDPKSLLLRLAELLKNHGDGSWSRSFSQSASEYDSAPEAVMHKYRSIFGGSGSFNDIVLHDGSGVPLQAENDELDRLRTELYNACHGWKS